MPRVGRQPVGLSRLGERLLERIRAIHRANWRVYGSRRIHAELHGRRPQGWTQARGAADAPGRNLRSGRQKARQDDGSCPGRPGPHDLVDRAFLAAAPDRLWVADITYLRTSEGWLYLVAVQDIFSRRIVGWSMADHMRTELVSDALQMALARRRPEPGLIWPSDQCSQFVSLAFGQQARAAGIAQSMGSKGDCFDNAVAESFSRR